MNKNSKLAIVIITGLLVATASWYFLMYKPAHPKAPKDETLPPDTRKPATGGIKTGPVVTTTPKPTPAPSVIGRVAYANADAVHVFNPDFSIYKTAKKGEWLGTIEGTETKGGYQYYRLSAGRYVYPAYVKLG
jgi:hypothetical protein